MTAGKFIYLNILRANPCFVRRYGYMAGLLPKLFRGPETMLSAFKTQNGAIMKFLQNYSATKPTLPKAFYPTGAQTKITISHI